MKLSFLQIFRVGQSLTEEFKLRFIIGMEQESAYIHLFRPSIMDALKVGAAIEIPRFPHKNNHFCY